MSSEERIAQVEQRLDELAHQMDRIEKEAEETVEQWQKRRSAPASIEIPDNVNVGPHYPGLG